MNKLELEERLIRFAVEVNFITKNLSNSRYHLYLTDQLTRSATSAALNYGEAQGSESQKDFIHKLRLTLKELRESHISLKILLKIQNEVDRIQMDRLIADCNQLISIFVASIKTASRKIQNH